MAYPAKEVNPGLAKLTLKFNGALAKLGFNFLTHCPWEMYL